MSGFISRRVDYTCDHVLVMRHTNSDMVAPHKPLHKQSGATPSEKELRFTFLSTDQDTSNESDWTSWHGFSHNRSHLSHLNATAVNISSRIPIRFRNDDNSFWHLNILQMRCHSQYCMLCCLNFSPVVGWGHLHTVAVLIIQIWRIWRCQIIWQNETGNMSNMYITLGNKKNIIVYKTPLYCPHGT